MPPPKRRTPKRTSPSARISAGMRRRPGSRTRKSRLAKIREAKAALEAEAKAAAEAEAKARQEAEEKRKAEGSKKNGKTPKPPGEEPAAKAQRNFTDPDSRILLTKDGYIQGHNAQAAVDGAAQVIADPSPFCTNFALNAVIVDMYTPQRASLQESPYIKPDTAMP